MCPQSVSSSSFAFCGRSEGLQCGLRPQHDNTVSNVSYGPFASVSGIPANGGRVPQLRHQGHRSRCVPKERQLFFLRRG